MKRDPRSLVALALAALPLHALQDGEMTSEHADEPIACELSTAATSFRGLLPRAETSFGAAALDGSVYVLGGYHGTPHEYDRAGQSDLFLRLSLADGSWQILASAGAMQGAPLVAHEHALLRAGGMVVDNAPGEPQALRSIDEVARYDPLADAWQPLPPLPERRSSHAAAVCGDRLVVCGGWTLSPAVAADAEAPDAIWLEDALTLDLAAPEAGWTRVPAPFRRRALGACASATHVFAIGGFDADEGVSSRVDALEVASGAWTRGPDFPEPGFGLSAVCAGPDVYASAGGGVVYRWRPGEAEWHAVTSLAFPRFFHQLVAPDEHELVALGGIARGGRVRHVESVRLDAAPAEPGVHVWTLPAPGAAKNRQGLFLRANALCLFGGNRTLEQHDFRPESFVAESVALDLAGLTWSPLQPLPAARQSLQTVLAADGQSAWAIGGFGHDGEAARTQDAILRYDFRYDEWSVLPGTLDVPRSQAGLLLHGEEVWVLGGLDFDPARGEDASFRHVLEIAAWRPAAEGTGFAPNGLVLPGPRRAFGMAELDGRVYLVGGMREDFERVERCDVLDLTSLSWATIPSPRAPRISPELVALGGRLYLAGGSSDRGEGLRADPSIEVFDPASGAWSVLVEELPIETRHLRMAAFGDRLLLVSTHHERPLVQVALLHPAQRVASVRDVARHVLR